MSEIEKHQLTDTKRLGGDSETPEEPERDGCGSKEQPGTLTKTLREGSQHVLLGAIPKNQSVSADIDPECSSRTPHQVQDAQKKPDHSVVYAE